MKLATRLVAVTAGTVLVAAATAGALLVRLERQQLVADELLEIRLLTRSLQVSVENALRDGQDPDIAELLGRLELVARQVDVLVFTPGSDGPRLASVGTDVRDALVQDVRGLTQHDEEVARVFDQAVGPPRLVAGVPLRTDRGDRIGTLVVTRPLTELEADLRSTTSLIIGSVVAFAASVTLVMLLLLRREVTGPLSEIAAATVALGEDLDASLSVAPQRSEELTILRDTLFALQRHLASARDARAAEAARREALERQLREADKLIVVGQLAAGLAHEIGSPLQVLVGRARLLGGDERQTDEVRRQARLIEEHAVRIARIVDRLRDVVRRRPSRIGRIDLVEPVDKVVWLLVPEARRRGVALTWACPPRPHWVQADPDEVQQVVLNLALNALQASASGGEVEVSVRAADDGATLVVADRGRGMDASTRAHAFDPFFSTRADADGTGLGLAVVQSIVDRHEAALSMDSTLGVGTRVEVTWRGADG